jgi:hypothetical protein
MTCTETQNLFSALADGALTPAEREVVDTHLAFCAECRRELARFERTVKLVRALDPAHAPAGFVDRVLAAARPAPWPRRLARRVMRPWPTLPLSAAALLVVGGLAVLLFRGSSEQQRAARYQSESPPAPTTAPPPSENAARPTPATSEPQQPAAPERRQPAPPASELLQGYSGPANKRAETSAETKARSDEARNVAPPSAGESLRTKGESTERAQDKTDGERERLAKLREAAPSVAQDAVSSPGARSAAAPPAADVQEPTAPARDLRDAAPRAREAAPRAPAATPPAIAATKAQPTPQFAPLSRTGPMTGIPAAPPDVSAQLRATDVSAAERSLIELAARVGGRQTGRRIDGGRVVVELAVPRDGYAEFVREAAALGALTIESQGTDRPVLAVAVSVGI